MHCSPCIQHAACPGIHLLHAQAYILLHAQAYVLLHAQAYVLLHAQAYIFRHDPMYGGGTTRLCYQ